MKDTKGIWVSKKVLIERIMTKAKLLGNANAYTFKMLEDEIAKYEKRLKTYDDDQKPWGLYDDFCKNEEYEYFIAPSRSTVPNSLVRIHDH